MTELDALRAELANTEGLLADARTEISHYMLSLSEVRTELATLREQHSRVLAENEFGRQAGEAKDARIAALTTVLNRLANGSRFPSDETLRVVHKVTTEVLGEAYEPFDIKMP